MAYSYVQYSASGLNYSVPFQFLNKQHIFVSVDGADVGFSWLSANLIALNTSPATGVVVEIRRVTPRDRRLIDFVDGSVLGSLDLDASAIQLFFLAQEALDAAERAVSFNREGVWDFKGRSGKNLGAPLDDSSPVSQGWVHNEMSTLADKTIFLFVEKES